MIVSELVALYLRFCAAERVHCIEARADRERVLRQFVEAHGGVDIATLKPFHLVDFVSAHPNWRSVSTRRAKSNYVRAVFQWAVDDERIDRNPFRRVRYAEAERRPDMPDDALERLAALANKPFEAVLRFLRLTGCRLNELCEARWCDVDLQRGVWIIPKHKSRKQTGKAKIVVLVAEAVAMLAKMAGDGDRSIFLNTRGRPWNRHSLGHALRSLKLRHGLTTTATLHGIRHRFGSAGVAAGAPLKLISAQLGHSTQAVTERYYVNLDGEIEAIRAAATMATSRKGSSR